MKYVIPLFLMLLIASCDLYHPKEMIKIGDERIKEDKSKFDSLVKISNRLALNYCTLSILTSNCISEIYPYVDSIKDVGNGTDFDIARKDEQFIFRYKPRNDLEDIIAVKDLWVAFDLQNERDAYRFKIDQSSHYGKIIYCFDEDKFKKCFPKYHYYSGNQIGSIPDSVHWVYFYDGHWGITTSSVFLCIDSTECKKILSDEK